MNVKNHILIIVAVGIITIAGLAGVYACLKQPINVQLAEKNHGSNQTAASTQNNSKTNSTQNATPKTNPSPVPSAAPKSKATPTPTPLSSVASAGIAYGVNAHLLGQGDSPYTTQLLDSIHNAHFTWVRIDVSLQDMPSLNQLKSSKISSMDQIVSMANARNIKVMFTLMDTPSWEASNIRSPWPNASDFGHVCGLFAQHFAGKVAAWELWNEPNIDHFMTPAYPVTPYVNMVKAAYPQIKAADPSTIVVASPTSYVDTYYLGQEYAAGLSGHTDSSKGLVKSFDALGVHPYNHQLAPDVYSAKANENGITVYGMSSIPDLHNLMAQHGDGDVPIWATEWGYSTSNLSESTQSDYDIAGMMQLGSYPYVKASFLYQMRDQTSGSTAYSNDLGILHTDLSPKSAYSAITNFLAQH